ncbi:glycerophosphodiester phosphodiesterase family protein [Microvirga sp. 0TCS3.31]
MTFDAPPMHVFDVEAHRGGAGLWPENTLEAFGRSLALGVSTLELDVHLTADDDVVVHHDATVRGGLADARRIRELTRTDLPPSMPLLRQVAALLAERGADPVRVNLEIKYDALDASGLTTRDAFVERVVEALRVDGLVARTSIQCFDWGVLDRVGEAEPSLARNLLVSPKYLRSADGKPSPWFDGLAVDDAFVVTAARQGFTAISPIHGSPFRSGVDDPAYQPFTTAELVGAAHAAGLAVVPYVVDDTPTMRHLVRLGVDGLITNHPERLRDVLADEGRPLPPAFPGGADNLPPVRSVSST